jgi:acetyltransferase-like isoleucine patch superfamily enzyme
MIIDQIIYFIERIEFVLKKTTFSNFGSNNFLDLRSRFINKKMISIGSNNIFGRHTILYAIPSEFGNNEKIKIGNNTYIGHYCSIHSISNIIIEDNVVFSDYIYVSNVSHGTELIEGESIMAQPWIDSGMIKIGEGTFVGHGAKILPGVVLGKYCIVGAGAIVTKSFEDYSVIAGNPAKLIKKRKIE